MSAGILMKNFSNDGEGLGHQNELAKLPESLSNWKFRK